MKTIVIYQSSTGFTKQYAEWIATDLQCKAVSIKEASEKIVREYDQVIFGGWSMANMVNGLDKIRKMNPKNLVIFMVGATPESVLDMPAIREVNHIANEPFFYMTGGMRFDKLNFVVRGMLKVMGKSVAKKENKTPADEFMAKMLGKSFDYTDRKQIDALVAAVQA